MSDSNINAEQGTKEETSQKEQTDQIREEDLFAGGYEEYVEKVWSRDINYVSTYAPAIETEIKGMNPKNKRKQPIKIIIKRKKKEFESPLNFTDRDNDSQNLDAKQQSAKEYPLMERAYLEIGLQTANESSEKSYQVPKVRTQNNFTQCQPDMRDIIGEFEKKKNKYLDASNVIKLENFLQKVRARMEEALQSNETIDIFQNDFDLDKNEHNQDKNEKKGGEKSTEARTFRDGGYSGEKNKKEKLINHIKIINEKEPFIAHTLFRNLTCEERFKVIGIPYSSHILFWNYLDPEINSPLFHLEVPMELTCFEFCPTKHNNVTTIVGGLYSGQLIFYEIYDLVGLLKKNDYDKKNKKDSFSYHISSITESHKTHITAMRWFPNDVAFDKKYYNLVQNPNHDIFLLITVGEDGQALIWDLKQLTAIWDNKNFEKGATKNDISKDIKPVIRIELNKTDCKFNIKIALAKVVATGLCTKITLKTPIFMVSTDEGQVYTVDWTLRVSPENPANNVKKVYSEKYYRPILSFEFSPFFPEFFLTLHDFHFCLWNVNKNRPIFISPNLKSSCYTFARFSPSRPAVIFFARNNGVIDIWDFLDESHKPSINETFFKETITYLEIVRYYPQVDEEVSTKNKNIYSEYFAIGDASGQMTVMEIPKLFTEKGNEEEKVMERFLNTEIERQEYMEMRYKALEEEQYKQGEDLFDDGLHEKATVSAADKKEKEKEEERREENELKNQEAYYQEELKKLLDELGSVAI